MSRVGIAHHHSAITVGGAHPTATFSWTFVSPRLMAVHPKMPLLTHPPPFEFSQGRPDPPLEGEGNSLSLRERVRVRVGIFMTHCSLLSTHRFFYSLLIAFNSLLLLLIAHCFQLIASSTHCFFNSLKLSISFLYWSSSILTPSIISIRLFVSSLLKNVLSFLSTASTNFSPSSL